VKIPHFGRVVLGPEVEIGANTTVDRATFGETIIGAGTKIDNLVQVGHNVVMGEACVVAGQAGFTGSVKLGRGVMVGGQAGINQSTVGDQAMIAAKAGVTKDVPPRTQVAGAPALEARKWFRCATAFERLPDLIKEVRELRQRIQQLEKERANGKEEL
jgi:UDP-3-O-[3-hydroxymyristoyl] glucosamine N-acyltransferase